MNPEIEYFNSQDAAKILGVNVSSIKRWTEEGKLECVRTAGGHRKFFLEHLANFLENNKKKASHASLFQLEDASDLEISFHILKGNFEFLSSYLVNQALESNREQMQKILNGLYLGQRPLYEIYDRLITPALYYIGDLSMKQELTIMEEHFATQMIRDSVIRLQGIIRTPRKKIGTAICMNLAKELHDIALKMIDHLLETRGFSVFFSGQITPLIKIENMFENYHPLRIYISSTVVEDVAATQVDLDHIGALCQEYNTELYMGGQGFDKLKMPITGASTRLNSFKEVYYT